MEKYFDTFIERGSCNGRLGCVTISKKNKELSFSVYFVGKNGKRRHIVFVYVCYATGVPIISKVLGRKNLNNEQAVALSNRVAEITADFINFVKGEADFGECHDQLQADTEAGDVSCQQGE